MSRASCDRRTFLGAAAGLGGGLATTSAAAAGSIRSPAAAPRAVSAAQPAVEIDSGRVRGAARRGVRSFKGVPYGASTAGPNRFLPPQPVEPWAGVRDVLAYGPQCPFSPASSLDQPYQENVEDSFLLYRGFQPHVSHEDCLRLNVWAPEGEGRRPVMVYMHGGAFAAGSGHDLLAYDGENLARRGDVVVITHNHRLNLFGYMDLSSYGGRWADSANLGLQDIVAVLKWVRANASAFGGDPDNVTAFGQSGGGGKVLSLMAMPSARGLFHKAIVQSGTLPGFGQMSADAGRTLTETVLRELEVSPSDPDALAALPTDRLCAAAAAGGRFIQWAPVVDGRVLPMAPGDDGALAEGVPLLVGTVLNEFASPMGNPQAEGFDRGALEREAAQAYGPSAGNILAAYSQVHPDRTPFEIWCAMQTAGIRAASYDLAARKYMLDGQAWQYCFTWRTPALEGRPKTFHSAEIAFAFDNAGLCENQTGGGPEALRLAGQMSEAWIAFARSGSPEHSGLPAWGRFGATRPTMIFDDPARVVDDYEGEGLRHIADRA